MSLLFLKFYVLLHLQSSVLQGWVSKLSVSWFGQSASGLSKHSLYLVWFPPPHDKVQSEKVLHDPQIEGPANIEVDNTHLFFTLKNTCIKMKLTLLCIARLGL